MDNRLIANISLARDVLQDKVKALEDELAGTMDCWRECATNLAEEREQNQQLRLRLDKLAGKGGRCRRETEPR